MQVRHIPEQNLKQLLDADAAPWQAVRAETFKLMGTPVGLQPTAAIRATWIDRRIGAIESVSVRAVCDGRMLAFRLEWADATQNGALGDTTSFPDAAAVLLPSVEGAAMMTMGAPGAAVNAWYWRADDPDVGRHVVAEGLGTTRTLDGDDVKARGRWSSDRWRVVIARDLRCERTDPVAQLALGTKTGLGVAIWEGGAGERAGIKAFSGDWQPLVLPEAGR